MSKLRMVDALLEEILEAQGVTDKTGWNLITNKDSGERYLVKTVNPEVHKLVRPNLSSKQAQDFERRRTQYRRAQGAAQFAKIRRDSPQTLRALSKIDVPADIGPETKDQAVGTDPHKEKKLATRMAQLGQASATYIEALKTISQEIKSKNPSISDKELKAQVKAQVKERGVLVPPEYDLCSVSIPGTNLYCGGNKEIPRDNMPQLKTAAVPGTPAWKKAEEIAKEKGIDPKDVEVNAENAFLEYLEKQKVQVNRGESMPAVEMKATQNQLNADKVAGMAWALATNPKTKDPKHPLRQPLIVSRDGYVLDGHHRWAALVTADVMAGKSGATDIPVIKVDMDIEDLVRASNKFGDKYGLQRKGMGAASSGTGKTGKQTESWNRSFSTFVREGAEEVKFVKLPPTKLPTGGWKDDWGKYIYRGKEWRLVSASDRALKGQRYFDVIGPNGKRAKNLHPFYHETPMGGVRASIASSGGNWPEKDFDAKDWV